MTTPAVDSDRVRAEFFQLAFQYYVAARFGASAVLLPVAGNLFHHAIEMFLKGELAQHLDESQRKKLGHNLTELWSAFKEKTAAEASLASFDTVIEKLSKFEDIRYPENIVAQGMMCSIGHGELPVDVTIDPPMGPRYELFVGDIDALVKAILDASGVNPSFFTSTYQATARTYLTDQNKQTGLWS